MTTYNGRSAQYQPGKEVPNKEPAISKFVVEKLYRVHRTRMSKMKPVVDCHVKIPSFLTDQTWKKTAEETKKKMIERENRDIYSRISKVEKNPGLMTKDYKAHIKRIEIKSAYLKRLKDHGRLVNVMKIQKENEYFLQRIDKAQPQYGRKKMTEWYHHHERFKDGRRSDPCAGHIFSTVNKDLFPKNLPPLNPSLASTLGQSSVATGSIYAHKPSDLKTQSAGDASAYRKRRNRNSKSGSPSAAGLEDPMGLNSTSLAESNSLLTFSQSQTLDANTGAQQSSSSPTAATTAGAGTSTASPAGKRSGQKGSRSSPAAAARPQLNPVNGGNAMAQPPTNPPSPPLPPLNRSSSTKGSGKGSRKNPKGNTRSSTAGTAEDYNEEEYEFDEEDADFNEVTADDNNSHNAAASVSSSATGGSAGTTGRNKVKFSRSTDQGDAPPAPSTADVGKSVSFDNKAETSLIAAAAVGGGVNNINDDETSSVESTDPAVAEILSELTLLVSRPMALPFEAKTCMVHVYSNKSYDENLYIKVLTAGMASRMLAERQVSIDKAYELVNAGGHSSQIVHSSENEDLASLSTLLINMFKEADDDCSGSLTFDEFQTLMEKVELGISAQELRFVISEADENENGVVDYEEFVPLAVDLIQSFRARNRAKTINSQKDVEVDDMIMKSISTEELQEISVACLEKVYEIDSKKYGLIRVPELKKCLHAVASTVGLRESEVNMICQMLPRDQFDRVKYNTAPNTFYETLSKVRFTTMKNAMIESQGSGLQKYLLDLCRDEEANIAAQERLNFSKDTFVHTGRIPFRGLINILSSSSRLSLSRLQVLVIMSEAHVQEGMINYFQFVPVVAKAIEIMFEPKALRQRAELIEKTDLSPEALLQGMSSEMFEHRLLTLFKSYDIDHSGGLDQNEFVACLESLDLQLTYGEMVALMAAADVNHSGILKFEDFVGFFTQNLLNLEREKHLRLLQGSLNNNTGKDGAAGATAAAGGNASAMGKHSAGQVSEEEQTKFIERLTAIFKLSDPEDTGLIPIEEFENVFKTFEVTNSSYLIDVMLSELHSDDSGMVEYRKALSSCAELLKVYRAREEAMEEHKEKEAWASQKADEALQLHSDEIHHIVRYLKPKLKAINDSCHDPFVRYNELLRTFRSSSCGLARVEANVVIQRLLHGGTTESTAAATGSGGASGTPTDTTSAVNSSAGVSSAVEEGGGIAKHSGRESREGNDQNTHKSVHGMNSFHLKSMRAPKVFRSVFSHQELFDAVYNARKVTIMRGLMEEVDSTALRSTVLEMLNEEAQRLKNNGEIPADSEYLPVDACFKVLENAHEFRLNHSQIMFIISWAECFDKDGTMLETDRFAEHCADIISKLSVEEMLDTRSEVMKEHTVDEKTFLNGMKEKDLEKHLEYAFTTGFDEKGTVENTQVFDTLKGIPRLALSDREATTIVAALHLTEPVFWKDILHQCVSACIQLCRERIIHRRVSLAATTSRRLSTMTTDRARTLQGYAAQQLNSLAERVLNYVKLENDGDALVIRLPIDNSQRRNTQIAPDDGIFFQNSDSNILFRAVRFLPWYEIKRVPIPPRKASLNRVATAVRNKTFNSDLQAVSETGGSGGPNATTTAGSAAASSSTAGGASGASGVSRLSPRKPSSGAIEEPQFETTSTMTGSLPVMLSVHAHENTQTPYTDTHLVAMVIDCRSMIEIASTLEVKLPTIALVDRDAAQQFAGNVCERLYIAENQTDHTRVLKMKPE